MRTLLGNCKIFVFFTVTLLNTKCDHFCGSKTIIFSFPSYLWIKVPSKWYPSWETWVPVFLCAGSWTGLQRRGEGGGQGGGVVHGPVHPDPSRWMNLYITGSQCRNSISIIEKFKFKFIAIIINIVALFCVFDQTIVNLCHFSTKHTNMINNMSLSFSLPTTKSWNRFQ